MNWTSENWKKLELGFKFFLSHCFFSPNHFFSKIVKVVLDIAEVWNNVHSLYADMEIQYVFFAFHPCSSFMSRGGQGTGVAPEWVPKIDEHRLGGDSGALATPAGSDLSCAFRSFFPVRSLAQPYQWMLNYMCKCKRWSHSLL